jgi:hypothetical protein
MTFKRIMHWLSSLGAAMAAMPDPHDQFHAVPVAWVVPNQPDGPPPGHPERLERR